MNLQDPSFRCVCVIMEAQSNKPEQTAFQDGEKLQLMRQKQTEISFVSDLMTPVKLHLSDDLTKGSMSTTAPQDTNVHILPPKDNWDKPIDRVVM